MLAKANSPLTTHTSLLSLPPSLQTYLSSKPYAAWLDLSPEDADEKRLLAKAKLAVATGVKFFVTVVSLSQDRLEKQDVDLGPAEKVGREGGREGWLA